MAENQKQHYIPSAYLIKYFDGKGWLHKVIITDNKNNKEYPNSINNICQKKNYYDNQLNNNPKYIETNLLPKIEPEFCAFQENIINQVFENLNNSGFTLKINKKRFSELLVPQLYRTPKTEEHSRHCLPEIIDGLKIDAKTKFPHIKNIDSLIEQMTHDLVNEGILTDSIMKHAINNKGGAIPQYLESRNWVFYYSEDNIPLSEDVILPVNLDSKKSGYYEVGFQTADVIFVQVHKNIILAMYHPNYHPEEYSNLEQNIIKVKSLAVNHHIHAFSDYITNIKNSNLYSYCEQK